MIFKGEKILRISLIVFSEKSCGNSNKKGERKEIPYWVFDKILSQYKRGRVAH